MRPALANFLRNPTRFSVLRGTAARPVQVAHVQTDGSFKEVSRTGVLLRTTTSEEYSLLSTYVGHKNSGHSEWCSVLDGILLSKRKDQGCLELENDCLGVIQALTRKKFPRDALSAYFYSSIAKEMQDLEHFGVRWIPRELNRADDLFREKK